MANLQSIDKSAQISFRCPAEWKKEIQKLAIDRSESVEDMLLVAISEGLSIALPEADQR